MSKDGEQAQPVLAQEAAAELETSAASSEGAPGGFWRNLKFLKSFFKDIPEKDRIPMGQKIAFSLGQKTEWLASGVVTSTFWMPYFNIGLEISPIVLGVILMLIRAWDAVSDPLVGNISDNLRTPWGRRRPMIFFAAITTAAIFPFIWNIPASVMSGDSWLVQLANVVPFFGEDWSNASKAMTVYLTLIMLLYFTSFTCWSMPYYGMQLELTPNYDERTRLNMIMAFVGKITGLVSAWAFVVVVFIGTVAKGDMAALEDKPAFLQDFALWIQPWLVYMAGDNLDQKPIVLGMQILCWFFAIMIVVMGVMPALFVKERYYKKEAKDQSRDPFWTSVKESARCLPLWSLISTSFFLVMGYSAIGGLGTYVSIYYVCQGDMILAGIVSGLKGSVLAFTGIALLPFFTWLGEKYDKRFAVMCMLGTAIFGHLLNYVVMTPENPYLQVIAGFFESSAIGAVWLFLPSMKADVADWDEVETHRRREGSINAFYSWFIKASLTLSMGIGGVVLWFSGFDASLEQQTDEAIMRMFHLYLLLPVVIWAVAFLSVWYYPITRQRADEIRTRLETRRGYI